MEAVMRFVFDDNVPDTLEDLATTSLSDVFETIGDDNFDDNLFEFLSKMPRTRKSTEEILKEIKCWDNYDLYMALITDFFDFLSDDELSEVVSKYKQIFCIPLPDSIQKSISERLSQ